jgi:lactaldehyde dehydrogenase/glycolaldehyde dehydrogenase
MFIGDEWVLSSGGGTSQVINPATEEVVAVVTEATTADVDNALDAAEAAAASWRSLPSTARAGFLKEIVARILAHKQELAEIIVSEVGKPITEALGEVDGTARFISYAAEMAEHIRGEILPSDSSNQEIWIRRVPFGVVSAITPWNYPAALVGRKIGPAIVAGNTVVLKPSGLTPLSCLAIAKLSQEAGLPPGVLNVVTGSGETVGAQLVRSPKTSLITMTGSLEVGKEILRQAAENVTVVSLELGGNAPFIVMDDADIDSAAVAAVQSRFGNCGQVCTANERTYVHRRVWDEFLPKYVDLASKLRLGDPIRDETQLGPKITLEELERVERYVEDAVDHGATVLTGGHRPKGSPFERGYWYCPTVVADVEPSMPIMRSEIFGPVSPVTVFDDVAEVVAAANDSIYGLSAYIFTNDFRRVMTMIDAVEFGEIYVNRAGPESANGFHIGYRQSGIGGDDGEHGLDTYLRRKTVYVNYGQ